MSEVSAKVEKPTISNLTGADARQKAAAKRFKELTDNPPRHKSGIGKKIVTGALVGAMAFEGGGMAYTELNNNEPVSAHTLQVDAMHPWNIGLENITVPATFDNNAEVNYIKAGVNAEPMTTEEKIAFLNQTPPEFVKPESGGHAPSIKVIFPVNPESAQSVKITKTTFDTKRNMSQPEDYYYYGEFSKIDLSENAIFNLPLIEGADKVKVKIAIDASQVAAIELIYNLNDGQTIKGMLFFSDNNYTPTDIFRNIPTYVPSGNGPKDDLTSTQEFDLKQNTKVPLFRALGATYVSLKFGTGQQSGGLSPTYEIENGKIQY